MSSSTATANLVSSIVSDTSTQSLLHANGLTATKVCFEDTGRSKGSCWGPNISDMTLTTKDGALMPVIRKPNFSDVTDDLPIDSFKLTVGNENGGSKSSVSLKDYLSHLEKYTARNVTSDEKGEVNLYHSRDSVVLTSSQCCVLPVDKSHDTQFAVQLFNYQSYADNPAVLVILVSKEGTSCQVVERSNSKLFFNDNGTAKWFKLERLQDYRERKTGVPQEKVSSFKEMKDDEKYENVLMMFQVPLKVKQAPRYDVGICYASSAVTAGCWGDGAVQESFSLSMNECKRSKSKVVGMDMGMLSLGDSEGKYIGTKGLKLERDDRFPIRCTMQFYRGTDENFISEKDIKDIAEQLNQQNKASLASGSLVCNDDTGRVTEPTLTNPLPTDTPFGKLLDRDYLNTPFPPVVVSPPVVVPLIVPPPTLIKPLASFI